MRLERLEPGCGASALFTAFLAVFAKELAPLVATALRADHPTASYSGTALPPGIPSKRAFYGLCRREPTLQARKMQRGWIVSAERWAAWLEAKSAPKLRLLETPMPSDDENAFRAALGLQSGGRR